MEHVERRGGGEHARRRIDNGGIGAISRDLICYSGLGSVPATLAPHDQPDVGGKRMAQGHRRRLALASIASHNPAMTPDLTDDDKATLADLLRETIERNRFPLPPRVRSVVLARKRRQ